MEAARLTIPSSKRLRMAADYQFLGFQIKAGSSLAEVLFVKHKSLGPTQSYLPTRNTLQWGGSQGLVTVPSSQEFCESESFCLGEQCLDCIYGPHKVWPWIILTP